MGRARRSRLTATIAALVLVVGLAGCGVTPTATPTVPPQYRVTLSCAVPFMAGGTWWEFVEPVDWPPRLPLASGDAFLSPYPVPGSVVLDSAHSATFVADVDGSRLPLRALDAPPAVIGGCL